MNELFGSTRAVLKERYALLTPGGVTPCYLPGWDNAACHVVVSPALGARFSQTLITLQNEGQCAGNTGPNQFFLYVIDGPVSILLDDRRHRLEAGSYVYLPVGKDMQLKSGGPATRILVFQKPYYPLTGVSKPNALVSHEREVKPQSYLGNEGARWQPLLPVTPAFDMSVNILSYQPGATQPSVSTQLPEQGILILRGQGIYRLNSDWHPVQADDVVWTAPYCPNWFVAVGKVPCSYIVYQDINRDPM